MSQKENAAALPVPAIMRVPGWERFRWLRAGFSTRSGGWSMPYCGGSDTGEQNLGWTGSDRPELVSAARKRFVAETAQGAPLELVTTRQCHGRMISVIEADHGPLRLDERTSALEGDGLLTRVPGLLLGIITADCAPVLVADTLNHAVGAFHAGWRGTLAGIVEQGVRTMKQRFGSRPEDLIAAIGPTIGPCCFAVGEEVLSGFASAFSYAEQMVSQVGSRAHLNLPEVNRHQLLAAGLAAEAIHVVAECTACTYMAEGRRKYFSHRAENGFTGRMLSAIGAVE